VTLNITRSSSIAGRPCDVKAYIFVADSIWVALQIFEQFCLKAGDANPLVAEPETDFNAKWPFKVIYFGIIEEPLRGYIAQYNKSS